MLVYHYVCIIDYFKDTIDYTGDTDGVVNHNGHKIDSNPDDFAKKTCLDQPGILHDNSYQYSFGCTKKNVDNEI